MLGLRNQQDHPENHLGLFHMQGKMSTLFTLQKKLLLLMLMANRKESLAKSRTMSQLAIEKIVRLKDLLGLNLTLLEIVMILQRKTVSQEMQLEAQRTKKRFMT